MQAWEPHLPRRPRVAGGRSPWKHTGSEHLNHLHTEERLVAGSKEECCSAYLPWSFSAWPLKQKGFVKPPERRETREISLKTLRAVNGSIRVKLAKPQGMAPPCNSSTALFGRWQEQNSQPPLPRSRHNQGHLLPILLSWLSITASEGKIAIPPGFSWRRMPEQVAGVKRVGWPIWFWVLPGHL